MHIFTIKSVVSAPSPFSIGVPLPKGKYAANLSFTLYLDERPISCRTKPTALWPDNTVKWLLIEGILPQTDESEAKVILKKQPYKSVQIKPKWIIDEKNNIEIHTKDHRLQLSKTEFLKLYCPCISCDISANVSLEQASLLLQSIDTEYDVHYDSNHAPLFCNIVQQAQFFLNSSTECPQKHLNLSARIKVYFELNKIDLQIKIHNPQPQIHHGGKWDLGNENSVYIRHFGVQHNFTKPQSSKDNNGACKAMFSLSQADDLFSLIELQEACETLELIQHSSGGEAWNSPNHKSADNKVHLDKKGASCSLNGKLFNVQRAEPSLSMQSSTSSLLVLPKHFWEKFPSSLIVNQDSAELCFTDPKSNLLVELQPGEIKSHDVSYILYHGEHPANISLEKAQLSLAPELISATRVLPWFDLPCRFDKLQMLIDQGLTGEKNFFAKREALDEFGWRNFGDIYADHEAHNHEGNEPFVSHYNNQYDPLYGFLKQWLISGDAKWKTLADDLFDHIVHIDIYHTELDKPEYNKGLFWHTDHYVQAQTATHRTYSKHQQTDVYIDHAGGGGPGAHHCYSSGLALYYWLTGNEDAFHCMIGMMDWMANIYEGDQTLLGLFLRIKNANYLKVPFNDRLLLGSGTGVLRNVFTDKYPLDRGTGNYVNILLDSFELTQDLHYLDQAERVIFSTISAEDNITQRNFDDVENSWYYVVFLQGITKYLYLNSSMQLNRSNRQAILQAFLLYSDYIRDSEAPYLTHAERLEYPNDTWTAQDLRKVQILCCAAEFGQESAKEAYLHKARELQTWVENKLKESDEKEYTRILVLMMQNYGALSLAEANHGSQVRLVEGKAGGTNSSLEKQQGRLSPTRALNKWRRVIRFVSQYSLQKERRHLVQRIPKLQKWLGYTK